MTKVIGTFNMASGISRLINKKNIFLFGLFVAGAAFFTDNFLKLNTLGFNFFASCSSLDNIDSKILNVVSGKAIPSHDAMRKSYDVIFDGIHLCSGEDQVKNLQFMASVFHHLKDNEGISIFLDRLNLHFERFDKKTKLIFIGHFFGVVHWVKDQSLKKKFRSTLVEAMSEYPVKKFEYLHMIAVLDFSGGH